MTRKVDTDRTDGSSASVWGQGSWLSRAWRSDERRRYWRTRLGMVSAVWLLAFLVAVTLGPIFAQNPDGIDLRNRLSPPTLAHPFGTDDLGRDLLARVLAGGRVTVIVASLATILPLLVGAAMGMFAGYRGGMVDEVLSRTFDVLTTIPSLLYGILLAVVLGGSSIAVIVALSISGIAFYGRLFRIGVLSAKASEYVQGVVALGFSPYRIAIRHILPNIIMPIVVVAAGQLGGLGIAEASLSFLGAGIQPPSASLGNIISQGQAYLQSAPWVALIPGVVLTLISLAFSFVGDAMRDAFDVRESIGPSGGLSTVP